jgi:hypothetical protein
VPRWLSILTLLLSLAGCASERSSPECKDVCRKQARCVDIKGEAAGVAVGAREQNKFDQSECINACTMLQRVGEGKKFVGDHVACVTRAKDDCAAVLECP